MILDEFITELKVYLDIKETDIEKDALLMQAAVAATGYVIANCSYYLLDDTVTKDLFATEASSIYALDAGPVKTVVASVEGVEVIDNPVRIVNNVAHFTNSFGVSGDFISLATTVGIDINKTSSAGDVAQAVALAAYFYKQADKGLDGVMQYGTGIKESAKLYEGIPKAIIQYFETKKIFRF